MLSVALSPQYMLDRALPHCRRGIVSFYSDQDWVLAVGTSVAGTMDREFVASAGRVGFVLPTGEARAALYNKLFQVAWRAEMAASGHTGTHFTGGAAEFVSRYVAPLVLAPRWRRELIRQVIGGPLEGPGAKPAPARAPVRVPDPHVSPPVGPATRPADRKP
jgi:hypothetical protein